MVIFDSSIFQVRYSKYISRLWKELKYGLFEMGLFVLKRFTCLVEAKYENPRLEWKIESLSRNNVMEVSWLLSPVFENRNSLELILRYRVSFLNRLIFAGVNFSPVPLTFAPSKDSPPS